MNETDLRLDGNAVGGLLSEVFAAEMTAALGTCGSCSATNALGATHAYNQAPGVVLRCPGCDAILICIVRIRDRLLVDLSGVRLIRLEPGGETGAY